MACKDSDVTVIIPTLADSRRAASLFGAIQSIQNQKGARPTLLIVINGKAYDDHVCERLTSQPNTRIVFQDEPSLPRALHTGRSEVNTKFFCFLDDDDIYFESAVASRLEILKNNPAVDIVATNGIRELRGKRTSYWRETPNHLSNPLAGLVYENWMASCGGLFRTQTVPVSLFSDIVEYYEWTYLAFRCTLSCSVMLVDVATFETRDSEGSLSKSEDYLLNSEELFRRILDLPLPHSVRYGMKKRHAANLHFLADHFRVTGLFHKAWPLHIRSLFHPSGWRYLAYTRKLLFKGIY